MKRRNKLPLLHIQKPKMLYVCYVCFQKKIKTKNSDILQTVCLLLWFQFKIYLFQRVKWLFVHCVLRRLYYAYCQSIFYLYTTVIWYVILITLHNLIVATVLGKVALQKLWGIQFITFYLSNSNFHLVYLHFQVTSISRTVRKLKSLITLREIVVP